jgi:hypothetical protein
MKCENEGPAAVENACSTYREMCDIRGRMLRKPYTMVIGAVGIGFVLGGGIFTRLTARIVGTGLRVGLMAALPMIQRKICEVLAETKSETNKENEK